MIALGACSRSSSGFMASATSENTDDSFARKPSPVAKTSCLVVIAGSVPCTGGERLTCGWSRPPSPPGYSCNLVEGNGTGQAFECTTAAPHVAGDVIVCHAVSGSGEILVQFIPPAYYEAQVPCTTDGDCTKVLPPGPQAPTGPKCCTAHGQHVCVLPAGGCTSSYRFLTNNPPGYGDCTSDDTVCP
jgi:hypothetical protein